MASVIENKTSTSFKLQDNLSYRFENDFASLSANVVVSNPTHNAVSRCSLQLWACNTPFNGGVPDGVRVAELYFMPQDSSQLSVKGVVPAHFPLAKTEFFMVMVLLSESIEGDKKIVDFFNFERQQQFLQPAFSGLVSVEIRDSIAHVRVGCVSNPRDVGNLSGTLSLEIWTGDAANHNDSRWLGGVNLGQLAGAEQWIDTVVEIPLDGFSGKEPLVLLLKEWTASGFVTRDCFTAWTPVVESSVAVESAKTSVPDCKDAAKVGKQAEETVDKVDATKTAAVEQKTISINTASVNELVSVKGISKSVATHIVENRPYKAVEDLSRVRGIAAKTLKKFRSLLSV